jgi:hypothetical protein
MSEEAITLSGGQELAELAARVIPPAVIFAEEAEHVADLRRRAADILRPILSSQKSAVGEAARLREAGQGILDRMFSTFTARNGRQVGVQGDDGEKCWIVHSDDITALEDALHPWTWWAGRYDDEYRLAGPCATREEAISIAYGDTEPGDTIFLVEAKVGAFDEVEELHEFTRTRNRSSVVRKTDKPRKLDGAP